jgi:hypothetical protein
LDEPLQVLRNKRLDPSFLKRSFKTFNRFALFNRRAARGSVQNVLNRLNDLNDLNGSEATRRYCALFKRAPSSARRDLSKGRLHALNLGMQAVGVGSVALVAAGHCLFDALCHVSLLGIHQRCLFLFEQPAYLAARDALGDLF